MQPDVFIRAFFPSLIGVFDVKPLAVYAILDDIASSKWDVPKHQNAKRYSRRPVGGVRT